MKRKNKLLIISIIVFVVIGLVCLGLALGFKEIADFFMHNTWAYLMYAIAIFYALIIAFIVSKDWIKRL